MTWWQCGGEIQEENTAVVKSDCLTKSRKTLGIKSYLKIELTKAGS